MQLPEKEVEWVAKLAHIKLSDPEKAKYAEELSTVLGYIDELQKVDTKKTEEVMQITGLKDVAAPDKIGKCEIPREEMLKRAPQNEKGCIKVKSVFDR